MDKDNIFFCIPNIIGYEIDINGNVRNKTTNKILKQQTTKGYKTVALYLDGKQQGKYVHRLLALTFIDNPNNYKCINHIDANKSNNAIENLEWCTQQHNVQHAWKMGLCRLPEKYNVDMRKKVLVNGIEFESMVKAGEHFNEKPCNLGRYLNGKRKSNKYTITLA